MKKPKKETLRVYFDTETFQQTIEGEELPIIVPYAIGACTDEPNSYIQFIGTDATRRFLDWLFRVGSGKRTLLYAFNLDYDFQAIRPYLQNLYPDSSVKYTLTGDKVFISGSIRNKTHKIHIELKDLWQWDKSFSLKKYYELINTYAKEDPIWEERVKTLGELKKLKLEDYTKINLRFENGQFVYEDQHNQTKALDVELEAEYLKYDVIGLPLVRLAIVHFKDLCIRTLNLVKQSNIWKDKIQGVLTLPSFAKLLLGIYLNQDVDHIFRPEILDSDYIEQEYCYFGGFVGGNRHHLEVIDQYDENNNPKIWSYDINSMYPWAMQFRGLPCYLPQIDKPDCDHCVWYSIYFEKEIRPGVLYEPKPEYDFFNNDFFGKHHFPVKKSGTFCCRQEYMLKELYDVFVQTHNSHIKISEVRYQPLYKEINGFIHLLYKIKSTTESKATKQAVKLLMNSLYGKMAERYHKHRWELQPDWTFEKLENEDYGTRRSILAGLYITSMSKAKLWSAIKSEVDNLNKVLYCDTDSIKLIVNNSVKLEIDDNELGYWKCEGKGFTHFIHPNKCKKYLAYNKFEPTFDWGKGNPMIACAGIPGDVLKELPLEELWQVYKVENDVEFVDCKSCGKENEVFQTVIRNVSIRFNPEKGKPITHRYIKGTGHLTPC